jgi:hypothetical protein
MIQRRAAQSSRAQRSTSVEEQAAVDERPYLSIILTGRNDDFGGDFNVRLFRALAFNHLELTRAGIPHEFVFVEWRPVQDKPYLASVLEREFPSLAGGGLVSFVVDVRYHEAYTLNPKLQFQEFIAKNIGIRHARGDFILTTNTDIYLGRALVAKLARREFEPDVLYRTQRIDLKSNCNFSEIDWNVLEDPRNYETINQIKPPCYTNASGDFLFLDRESYKRLRGFNEVYRVAKVHMDSNFCVKAYTSGIPLVPIDTPVYHVGEGTLNSQAGLYRDRPGDAPWGNVRWKHNVIYDNDDGWGLHLAPISRIGDHMHYLEFDWAAAPPLLQLRRVVLPAARVGNQSIW